VLDEYLDVRFLNEERFLRSPQISLTVGGVFQELSKTREIAACRRDVAVRLDAVRPQFAPLWNPAMRGGSRDEHVIARADAQGTEHGFHDRFPGFDVDALVAQRIPIQGGRLSCHYVRQSDVSVAED
jgi:hypothetical protein